LGGGLRLALSLLTVAPVRTALVDRGSARVAMIVAPAVGLVLGAVVGLAVAGLAWAGAPPLVAGVAGAALLAGLTRGMHLDGLADTADGLGCYGDREKSLAVMRQSDIGPFGVVAIVLALLAQAAALGTLASRPSAELVFAVAIAAATGRTAATIACRRGVPPARPEGMGALVAGLVPGWAAVGWVLALAALAWPLGPAAVPLAALAGFVLVWHVVRRFGGITGDILGAAIELAGTICLCILTITA
jgi:adenosylcobinamide-GDP ribazoletransferase